MHATNSRPVKHAPFAQETAERQAPADSHHMPPPPDARPWGRSYHELEQARLTPAEERLADVMIEHVVALALDVLMERIDARFDETRDLILSRLGHLPGVPELRDVRRPAPRPADTTPPAHDLPPWEEAPQDEPTEPGDPPTQAPEPADDPHGEEHDFDLGGSD